MTRKKVLKFKKPKRKLVNWGFIKPLWCSDKVSNLGICKEYEKLHHSSPEWKETVTETAIRKRASRGKWKKNLSERVNEKYRENLVRPPVTNSNQTHLTDAEIVEKAAQIPTDVRNMQRGRAVKMAELCDKLNAQLSEQMLYSTKKMTIPAKRLLLGELVKIFNALILATSRLQVMESEAFNLNEKGRDEAAERQIALNEVISLMPIQIQEELRNKAAKRQKLLG